jgi:hypothetical protein
MQTGDRTWSVVGSSFTVTDGDAAIYYCYLRCPVNVALTSGYIIFTQNQYKTKGTDGYYWFLVGTLGSVYNNRREFYTSYGFSFINGNNITTGKVQSHNGSTYFDLDNNEIVGRIIFRDGVVSGYVSIVNEEGDERAWLNGASTPEDDIVFGVGGTKEENNPPFKVYEDGEMHAANDNIIGRADGSGQLAGGAISWSIVDELVKLIINAGNLQLDVDGNVVVTGKIQSASTGKRIVIDPTFQRLIMYDDLNRIVAKLEANAEGFLGGALTLKQYSGTNTSSDRTSYIGDGAIALKDDVNNKFIFIAAKNPADTTAFISSDYIPIGRENAAIGQWYREGTDGEFLKVRSS